MKSREDLTGEPHFPALVSSLKGGGVLYEPSCPPLRLLTHGKRFMVDLVLTPPGQMRILTGKPYLFMSVDSIAFVRLQRSHAQLSLPSFVPFFDQTPENAKTKGALEAVCTPTLKSVLG